MTDLEDNDSENEYMDADSFLLENEDYTNPQEKVDLYNFNDLKRKAVDKATLVLAQLKHSNAPSDQIKAAEKTLKGINIAIRKIDEKDPNADSAMEALLLYVSDGEGPGPAPAPAAAPATAPATAPAAAPAAAPEAPAARPRAERSVRFNPEARERTPRERIALNNPLFISYPTTMNNMLERVYDPEAYPVAAKPREKSRKSRKEKNGNNENEDEPIDDKASDIRIQKMCDAIASDYCLARSYYDRQELEGALIFFMLCMRGLIDLSHFSNTLYRASENAFLLTQTKTTGGFCPRLPRDIKSAQREVSRYILPLQQELKKVKIERLAGGTPGVGGSSGTSGDGADSSVPCRDVKQTLTDDSLSFDDIVGQDEAKEQLRTGILYPLLYPRLFTEASKGILLYGPPGVGKTMIVRAFVNELQKQASEVSSKSGNVFLQMRIILYAPKGGDLKGKYVGETEKNITKYFTCASKKAGICQQALASSNAKSMIAETRVISVLFIDEVEALVPSRQLSETTIASNAVATFLQEMDGVTSNPNVIVIAATNYPWHIDAAVLRRFSSKIYVGMPDVKGTYIQLQQEIAKHIQRVLAAPKRQTTIDYDTTFDGVSKRRRAKSTDGTSNRPALEIGSDPQGTRSTEKYSTCVSGDGFPCGGAINDVCLKPWKQSTAMDDILRIYTFYNRKYFPNFTDKELWKLASILVSLRYSNSDIHSLCTRVFNIMGIRALLLPYKVQHIVDPRTLIGRPKLLNEPCGDETQPYDLYVCSTSGDIPAVGVTPKFKYISLFRNWKSFDDARTLWPNYGKGKFNDLLRVIENQSSFESIVFLTSITAKQLAEKSRLYPLCMISLTTLAEAKVQNVISEAMYRGGGTQNLPSQVRSIIDRFCKVSTTWIRNTIRVEDYSDRTFVTFNDLILLSKSHIDNPSKPVDVSLYTILEIQMLQEEKAALKTSGKIMIRFEISHQHKDSYTSRIWNGLTRGLSYLSYVRYLYNTPHTATQSFCIDDVFANMKELFFINHDLKIGVRIANSDFMAIDHKLQAKNRATPQNIDFKVALAELKRAIIRTICPIPKYFFTTMIGSPSYLVFDHLYVAINMFIEQREHLREQDQTDDMWSSGSEVLDDSLIDWLSWYKDLPTELVSIVSATMNNSNSVNQILLARKEMLVKDGLFYDITEDTEYYRTVKDQNLNWMDAEQTLEYPVYGSRQDPQHPEQMLLHQAYYLAMTPAIYTGSGDVRTNRFEYNKFLEYDIETISHTEFTLTRESHTTILSRSFLTLASNVKSVVPISGLSFSAGERSMTVCVNEGIRHRLITLDFVMSDFEQAMKSITPSANSQMLNHFETYRVTGEIPKDTD
jgi:SpoVK/Ycf46/Vps4 family AAA+-type ATPase